MQELLDTALMLSREASQRVMSVYGRADLEFSTKDDNSPLTQADILSEEYLRAELGSRYPYPILAEESPIEYQHRRNWEEFWLIDPLDGTKDFLARNGDFTINIAFVRCGEPVVGVVALPAQGLYYGAALGEGAFRLLGEDRKPIFNTRVGRAEIGLDSRFHSSEQTRRFFEDHRVDQIGRYGSALKFCKLAEGSADIYPRFAPTMEWDTAAGHCILRESGCILLDAESGEELSYNKSSLVNPWFIACRANLETAGYLRSVSSND